MSEVVQSTELAQKLEEVIAKAKKDLHEKALEYQSYNGERLKELELDIEATLRTFGIATHISVKDEQMDPDVITHAVAQLAGLEVSDLLSRSQKRTTTTARQVAMFILYRTTPMSYPEIGEFFGRDHTTVMNGVNQIEKKVKVNSGLAIRIAKLTDALGLDITASKPQKVFRRQNDESQTIVAWDTLVGTSVDNAKPIDVHFIPGKGWSWY